MDWADWGHGITATSNLVTQHSEPYPAIDPRRVQLPSPFVVCVVGASRGIGAGIAAAYAQAGASGLVLASRRRSGLEETAARCRAANGEVEIEIVEADIASAEAMAALAERVRARFGHLDVAVVNSGYSGPVVLKLTETDPVTFQNAANVNYVGTFLSAKFLVPLLQLSKHPGRAFVAVNTGASFIVRGPIANAQYCISKAAQLKLMEVIHEQYSSEAEGGLSVFAIHPGGVRTEMAEESAPKEILEHLTESPDLCGAACVFLTKDGESKWLSGRYVSALWDVDELKTKKDQVVKGDLLKFKLAI